MFVVRAKKPKARRAFQAPAAELLGCTETLQSVASWKMDESSARIRHFFSPCNTVWQWFVRRSEQNCLMDMDLTVSKSRKIKIKIKKKTPPPQKKTPTCPFSKCECYFGVMNRSSKCCQTRVRKSARRLCVCVCVCLREGVGVSHPITEVWKYWALQSGNISRRSGSASGHESSGSRRKRESRWWRIGKISAPRRLGEPPGGVCGPTVWALAKRSGNSWEFWNEGGKKSCWTIGGEGA